MEQKKKRSPVSIIIVTLIFAAGLSLLMYPVVANYVNYLDAHKAIDEYREQVETIDENEYEDMLSAVKEFNDKLAASNDYISLLPEDELAVYNSLLNITGTGIMGYVDIPKVNIFLPIYHGTDEAVLSMGAGHFEGSSLPIGGENSHVVLSGHSGLPSAKLFTDIDQLLIGDTFSLHVLDETLYYEVDYKEVVVPEALENMRIEKGFDYCSLTTCTPYGVNTHRLIVRGHRIDTPDDIAPPTIMSNIIQNIIGWRVELLIMPIAAAILVAIIVIANVRKRKRK